MDADRPNVFRQEVKTADGFVKTVVADNAQELAEGVAAVKNDAYPVSPDLHNPAEPNAIVSPDNKQVEDAPGFIDNDAGEEAPAKKPTKK